MKTIRSPKIIRLEIDKLKRRGKCVGFVPTMGALHEGHLKLVRTARRENNVVVVSIFVNPAQFGPKEDFKKYPRPFARDAELLRKAGVDYLFHPSVETMYPKGYGTFVQLCPSDGEPDIMNVLCGQFRPGHFRGVATVVTKLFCAVGPDRVYFGAKDYQQSVIVRRLIRDLNLPIKFRLIATVRETDGLAKSSRNRYLSGRDRERARAISGILFWCRGQILKGCRNLAALRRQALAKLSRSVDHIDYLEIVDPGTLQRLRTCQQDLVILTACDVGGTRLIDNVIIKVRK